MLESMYLLVVNIAEIVYKVSLSLYSSETFSGFSVGLAKQQTSSVKIVNLWHYNMS